MTPVETISGESPIILGLPHTGTYVPDEINARLNARGQALADTDWHVDQLYAGLLRGASMVRATFHRYVIDANRDPGGISLYPGQNTTGLVPETDFDGAPIWDVPPERGEITERLARYHTPYHTALAVEIARVRDIHGVAILYDCHSIRSKIPFLFEGALPDFNIGTNGGQTCDRRIETAVADICATAPGYTSVLNGRFKGGWTTRHYGNPKEGVHAIQMELAQSSYLSAEAPPWGYAEHRATPLRTILSTILKTLADLALELGKR